ncbi:rubrerythrin-like domain-containing protein [Natrinema sp. HArc-T2]
MGSTKQIRKNLYECMVCGARMNAHHQAVCANCSGEMRNLSNTRE